MTTATNRLPISQRPTLRLKLGPSPATTAQRSVPTVPERPVGANAPPALNRAPAPQTRKDVLPTPPALNAVEVAGRARRAERRAAIEAEKAEAERRAVEKVARIERQAGKEAQRLRVLQMQDILYERYPALFKMFGPRLPMKVGIDKDIIAAAPDLDAGEVKKAIRFYALSGSYTQAVVAGALRYNLYGQPAGVVTETEARWTVVKIR